MFQPEKPMAVWRSKMETLRKTPPSSTTFSTLRDISADNKESQSARSEIPANIRSNIPFWRLEEDRQQKATAQDHAESSRAGGVAEAFYGAASISLRHIQPRPAEDGLASSAWGFSIHPNLGSFRVATGGI